jgi:hypothetical protein
MAKNLNLRGPLQLRLKEKWRSAWYYEEKNRIDVVVEAKNDAGHHLATVIVPLSHKRMIEALRRAGKLPTAASV